MKEIEHKYPIGKLVEITYGDTRHGGPSWITKARLFVVHHNPAPDYRYALANRMPDEWIDGDFDRVFTRERSEHRQIASIYANGLYGLITDVNEKDIKPVEITDDILEGFDTLNPVKPKITRKLIERWVEGVEFGSPAFPALSRYLNSRSSGCDFYNVLIDLKALFNLGRMRLLQHNIDILHTSIYQIEMQRQKEMRR